MRLCQRAWSRRSQVWISQQLRICKSVNAKKIRLIYVRLAAVLGRLSIQFYPPSFNFPLTVMTLQLAIMFLARDRVHDLTLPSSQSEAPTDSHRPRDKFITSLQVVGSFLSFSILGMSPIRSPTLLTCSCRGVANSFGIFQTY